MFPKILLSGLIYCSLHRVILECTATIVALVIIVNSINNSVGNITTITTTTTNNNKQCEFNFVLISRN